MTLSDSRPARRQNQRWSRSSDQSGSPPITRSVFPTCRAHYPGGPERVHLSIASPSRAAFPHSQQGRRPRQKCFEACSGFTRVTARWIAQPPEAAFVTRLRRSQLPNHAARQLPDQSTTIWVEPSSTDTPRLRGALEIRSVDKVKPTDVVGSPSSVLNPMSVFSSAWLVWWMLGAG